MKLLELGANLCLVTYRLVGARGSTLRSSIWRGDGKTWKLIFHQGTREKSATQ